MAEQCEHCGRPFDARSKPRWAFTPEAKPLGLMHTRCAAKANPRRMGIDASTTTEREAQFIAWTDLAENDDDEGSPRTFALIMAWAHHPSLEPGLLSDNQRRWLERYPPERQVDIRAAYDELVREFEQWERSRG